MTIAHDTLDLTVQAAPEQGPHPHPPVVTSGSQDWIFVQTYLMTSLYRPQPVLTSDGWLRTVGHRALRILQECFLVLFLIGVHLFARSLDNHWILKPWNMARAVDTHICADVDTIIRLAESIPKVRYYSILNYI